MNIPAISVLVTVYNAEKFLERCLNSIFSQTFLNYEVIIVDDGSTDSSGIICDRYALTDSRVRCFHKANGGVASARQFCLEQANGEYFIFVDSDDWCESNMLYLLYSVARSDCSDIIVADYNLDELKANVSIKQPDVHTSADLLYAILETRAIGSLWNKLIRKSLANGIRFDYDIFFCEDVLFLTKILLKNEVSVANLHSFVYHYVENPFSIVHSVSKKTFENRFMFVEKLEYLLKIGNKDWESLVALKKLEILGDMAKSMLFSPMELCLLYREQCVTIPACSRTSFCEMYKYRKKRFKKNMLRSSLFFWICLKEKIKKILE